MTRDPASITDDDVALQAARTLARVGPGVGHELANRLGAVRAFGAVLGLDEHVVREYGVETIDAVREAGDEALQLSQALLELVRQRPPARVPVRPDVALAAALRLAAPGASASLVVDVDVPEDLPEVEADPARLHQALVATLVNAREALGHPRAAGRLTVGAREVRHGAKPAVEVRVTDDAPPVPEADVPHLFDPRPPAGCTARAGLDLAVARHLLALDGGGLRFDRAADGSNALVVDLLPASAARHGPEAPEPGAPGPPAGEPAVPADEPADSPVTVLVCDDTAAVRELLLRLLDRSGIRAIPAQSGAEALAVLDARPVDVVLADNRMAGMSAQALHAAVAARHPDLRRRFVIVSGDPEDADLVAFARAEGLRVLPKPFDAAALVAVLREVARA